MKQACGVNLTNTRLCAYMQLPALTKEHMILGVLTLPAEPEV